MKLAILAQCTRCGAELRTVVDAEDQGDQWFIPHGTLANDLALRWGRSHADVRVRAT